MQTMGIYGAGAPPPPEGASPSKSICSVRLPTLLSRSLVGPVRWPGDLYHFLKPTGYPGAPTTSHDLLKASTSPLGLTP